MVSVAAEAAPTRCAGTCGVHCRSGFSRDHVMSEARRFTAASAATEAVSTKGANAPRYLWRRLLWERLQSRRALPVRPVATEVAPTKKQSLRALQRQQPIDAHIEPGKTNVSATEMKNAPPRAAAGEPPGCYLVRSSTNSGSMRTSNRARRTPRPRRSKNAPLQANRQAVTSSAPAPTADRCVRRTSSSPNADAARSRARWRRPRRVPGPGRCGRRPLRRSATGAGSWS
ncbi:hypothetical protein HEP73_02691 [Xanthomonas sp. GW]|nr:hypothetical protein HEP73_02691 [Xanthomonas sp. GW]